MEGFRCLYGLKLHTLSFHCYPFHLLKMSGISRAVEVDKVRVITEKESFVAACTQMQKAPLALLGFGQNRTPDHLHCKSPRSCCLAFWPGPLVHP